MPLLDAARVGPCLAVLHEGAEDATPMLVMPSTWGTVNHYVRLARGAPTTVWGIENGYLRTGDATFMQHDTLESQAVAYAEVIGRACAHTGRTHQFHILGGSFGALLAQKTAAAAQRVGSKPSVVVLIDPPPPGPGTLPRPASAWIAGEAIRLGQQVAGVGVDHGRINAVIGECMEGGEWELAVAVTQELATLGLGTFDKRTIAITRRRFEVYKKHLELWEAQDLVPEPLKDCGGKGKVRILLFLSSRRRDFFDPIHGDCNADALEMYGECETLQILEGEHTEVVQRVSTGREVDAANSMWDAIVCSHQI